MNFADPWFGIGWGLAVGGGGYGLLASLFYLRWKARTYPCRFKSGLVQRLTRKDLDVMMDREPDVYMSLMDENPHLGRWHMGGIEPPGGR